ncbi:hypothetical protein CWI38_2497p0020 [Hamiltosporidium tvaerminnensis]|uniref:Uncharacterized protein n=1 Tax=Hamiltosporidium tvaerminnensis TaxID=1176355 RepID=A0A4Q9LGJ9_9MICR|nr:hypothetical protein CWI38_2497p0020 [Hamiltosporidium tvaerminnensis]
MDFKNEIDLCLENIKDRKWIKENKKRMRIFFLNNKEALEELNLMINTPRNYCVLRAFEKLEIPVQENVLIDSLNTRNNLNQYMYGLIFYLHQKKLISSECMDIIKEKFKEVKNYDEIMSETEKRCILERIESDRIKYKRDREMKLKVYDREIELNKLYRKTEILKEEEILNAKCISKNLKILYILDFDYILFMKVNNLERKSDYNLIKDSINSMQNILKTIYDETYDNLYEKRLDLQRKEFLKLVKEKFAEKYIEMTNKNYFDRFLDRDLYIEACKVTDVQISRVVSILRKLFEKSLNFVLVTSATMSQVLAEMTFFRIDCEFSKNVTVFREFDKCINSFYKDFDKIIYLGYRDHDIGNFFFKENLYFFEKRISYDNK